MFSRKNSFEETYVGGLFFRIIPITLSAQSYQTPLRLYLEKNKRILGKTELLATSNKGKIYPIDYENESQWFDFQILSQQGNSFIFQFSLYSIEKNEKQRRQEILQFNIFQNYQQYEENTVNSFDYSEVFPSSKTEIKWILLISDTIEQIESLTKQKCEKISSSIGVFKKSQGKNAQKIEEKQIFQYSIEEEKASATINQSNNVKEVKNEEEKEKAEVKDTKNKSNFEKKSLKKSAFILIIALFITMFFGNFITNSFLSEKLLKKQKRKK